MKNYVVDARGLSCPRPVILTLKAMNDHPNLTTIVDNRAAVENVSRLAKSRHCQIDVEEREDGIYMYIRSEGAAPAPSAVATPAQSPAPVVGVRGPRVLFVPSDRFGRGDDELGVRLSVALFHTLLDVVTKPDMIIFMNSGVRLVVSGSRAVDDIKALADQGIEILVCGTCLEYYQPEDELAVGLVSNMFDIATALMEAGSIVEL